MNCPWCSFESSPRGLHAHLAEVHPDRVVLRQEQGRTLYAVACPVCGDEYERAIKPRSLDPAFLEEHEREIRLVGFDMLVNHLIAEHGQG